MKNISCEESFWDTENENISRVTNRILISKSIEDLEKEVIQAKEYLDHIETIRATQHQFLMKVEEEYVQFCDSTQYPEYEKMLNRIGPMEIELNSELENQVLKIRLNYLLPIYPKTKNIKIAYYKALQDIYQFPLQKQLILQRDQLPNFIEEEKVFVLMVQYFNNNNVTDLDNRFHSFIFNVLRNSQITPDDRWQKLSYMEDGRKTDQKPYTEIFLGSYKILNKIIELSYENISK